MQEELCPDKTPRRGSLEPIRKNTISLPETAVATEHALADERPWFVYLLRCRGGVVYAGATPDLAKRMRKHRAGTGARFTRSHPPESLLGAKQFPSKAAALSMEYQVKQLTAAQKHALAAAWSSANAIDDLPAILQALS